MEEKLTLHGSDAAACEAMAYTMTSLVSALSRSGAFPAEEVERWLDGLDAAIAELAVLPATPARTLELMQLIAARLRATLCGDCSDAP